MLYLGEQQLREIGFEWDELVDQIEASVHIMDDNHFAQPIKPYLRFNDPNNRIIAMPAYIGGTIHAAGLKWIASFPGNHRLQLPRAHSVTILNDADTGEPHTILNTALVSAVRTAAVSGLMLRYYLSSRGIALGARRVGIIGFGPIGKFHYEMCKQLLSDRIESFYIYDVRSVSMDDIPNDKYKERVTIASSWEQLYTTCNVIITCTVSPERYINLPPAPGVLLLDVSLRDYKLDAIKHVNAVVVDSWTEVCRENTDIELLHLDNGLQAEETVSLGDVVCRAALSRAPSNEPILFCPMGMAVFDIAIAAWFARKGIEQGIGIQLP
ncbi:2,3-diaminopropionate biosynthesis protein SbnB [Paenibacillus sp. GSMTC-2017]|uniref:2,3-diaminopropionate biosynthesis protein SbnB n=1 Tax=Paenibacillus sp. GSMTC-2017 TaxID=2794350 RepID=UPI0018D97D69|nr:2,3-diaminopropionate biosynthesis protein SbnB [Paenibacillus sp. GSMTC-2017]MBH5318643.1 2,3-diaminopropionate biosynthesis protein SbnB [Paenibacillus sp. GSMTC-2017]